MVLVLRPGDRQGEPRGVYEVSVLGDRVLSFEFDVVCAWKLKADELLAGRDPGLLPLIPFTEGASTTRVDEAFQVLAELPGQRGVELQVVLAAFSGQVFPAVGWLDKIDEEILMESTVYQEIIARGIAKGELEGRRKLVARFLRVRLGKNKRTEALVTRLPLCTETALEKVGDLLVGSKKKPDLLAAIERLVPKEPERA